MSDAPLVPGPIFGLRTWGVAGERGAEYLTGPKRDAPWPRGGGWLEADCEAEPRHAPPGADCECGLHAWHPRRAAARRVCGLRGTVPGILEAAGAVEVHADGFRAQRGRPSALVLLPRANARLLERLATAYDAELLRLDGPGALLEHCRAHDLGLSADVVAELVGAEALAEGRRRRRRRGVRAAVGAAIVAIVLAGIALAVDPRVEHGKTLYGRGGEFRVP
jgi:hypothetical protein